MASSAAEVATDARDTERENNEEPIRCRYCKRRFADEALLVLHCGLEHGSRLTEDERIAFEGAYRQEESGLRVFRLKALLALVAVYFVFLFAYSVFG